MKIDLFLHNKFHSYNGLSLLFFLEAKMTFF